MKFKINKEWMRTKGTPLASELFHYYVGLMPFLYLLNIPIVNISLGLKKTTKKPRIFGPGLSRN